MLYHLKFIEPKKCAWFFGTSVSGVINSTFTIGMIAEKKANKIIFDKKTEWLFICRRNIFKQGIMKVMGSERKADYTLILNKHGECIGFGKILSNLDKEKAGLPQKTFQTWEIS